MVIIIERLSVIIAIIICQFSNCLNFNQAALRAMIKPQYVSWSPQAKQILVRFACLYKGPIKCVCQGSRMSLVSRGTFFWREERTRSAPPPLAPTFYCNGKSCLEIISNKSKNDPN